MTSIWTLYSERRPTKEDADVEGKIYIRTCCTICHLPWDYVVTGNGSENTVWCRTADLDRATGFQKPRKLHSAWREPKEAQWSGNRLTWIARRSTGTATWGPLACSDVRRDDDILGWQPCDPPPVWEDET